MEETVCEIICGALTTLAVKGQMMMMMTSNPFSCYDRCKCVSECTWQYDAFLVHLSLGNNISDPSSYKKPVLFQTSVSSEEYFSGVGTVYQKTKQSSLRLKCTTVPANCLDLWPRNVLEFHKGHSHPQLPTFGRIYALLSGAVSLLIFANLQLCCFFILTRYPRSKGNHSRFSRNASKAIVLCCVQTTVNKRAPIHDIIPVNDMVHRPK